MKSTAPEHSVRLDIEMIGQLEKRRIDAAVIFTVYSQNPLPAAFLCHLAGIPLRLAHCHENPYQLLTDWAPDPEPGSGIRHEVQRQLDLVATVGATTSNDRLSIAVPHHAHGEIIRQITELGINLERPWTVVHPGATAPSRRYPWQSYAEVVRALVQDLGWQIIFTGNADEQSLVAQIRERTGVPTHSLAGRLSLAHLAALIEVAPVVITNNTGPAHIAAATGTPVVDLYALTNPQHTPWRVANRTLSHDVPCRNCYKSICPEGHHNCLALIPPGTVVQAADDLLTKTWTGQKGW